MNKIIDKGEVKSEAEHRADYRAWKDELIMVAVNQFDYKEEDIRIKVEDDDYVRYFGEYETPFNTMQLSERDGI